MGGVKPDGKALGAAGLGSGLAASGAGVTGAVGAGAATGPTISTNSLTLFCSSASAGGLDDPSAGAAGMVGVETAMSGTSVGANG